MRATTAVASIALVLATAAASSAQSAQELAGLWTRLPQGEAKEKFYRFSATPDGKLQGKLLNPPEGLQCEVVLEVAGGKVTGAGTWVEGDYRTDPPAKWELQLRGGRLEGRIEWLDFGDGKVYERGWETNHRFEKLSRVGLLPDGDGAEEPFGDPIKDLPALAGGWAGPGGAWVLEVTGDKARLVAQGHHDGAVVDLALDKGALKGKVAALGTAVELAFSEEKLEGRAAWVEGKDAGEHATSGWAPLSLTRLSRVDAGGKATSEEPGPGDAAPLDGVWRRDDGLYLRLRVEHGQAVGVLGDKSGAAKCRVQLSAQNGKWVGTANWDGVEARWELSAAGGQLSGRCEWVDVHERKVVARGWSWRAFKPLRRVG